MLKTLRIASIFTVIAAAGVIIAVGIIALRPDPEIQAFLAREGVVEQFRKQIEQVPQKKDAVSPLESAAKAFALRIDPPPPPPPPKPPAPPKPQPRPNPKPEPVRPPVERNRPQMSAKFTLIATARYPKQPEKSMALLKNLQNEFTWYRQGEQVGHLKIHEIRDGSIVLYQGDQFNSEIYMPVPPSGQTLLKSDQTADGPRGPSTVSVSTVDQTGEEMVISTTPSAPAASAESSSAEPTLSAGRRTIPSRLPGGTQRRLPVSERPRSRPVRSVPYVPQQTPEQQKESIQESISSIESIMNRPPVEGQSQEAYEAEQEAWKQLLKALAAEKQNLEEMTEESRKSSEQSPPADSSKEETNPSEEGEKSDKIQ